MNRLSRSLLLLAIVSSLTGCGERAGRVKKEVRPEPIVGALTPVVRSFEKAPGEGACDKKFRTMRLRIANAVDEHQAEIAAYSASLPESDDVKRVQVGPLVVREEKLRAPKLGWQTTVYSWNQLIEKFESMKTEATAQDWYNLSVNASGILTNDSARILKGASFSTGHADLGNLIRVQSAVDLCLKSDSCVKPELTAEDIAWVRSRGSYAKLFESVQAAETKVDAASLKKIQELNEEGISLFDVLPNSTVRREGTRLILPITAGPFASIQNELASYIEPVWKSDSLQLKIQWLPDPVAEVFKMLKVDGVGVRAWVSTGKKTVNLASDIRAKTLAHEIGHVLGLPDRYYTLWSEEKCEYTDEFQESDLMSDSSFGSVQDSDWDYLKAMYVEEVKP